MKIDVLVADDFPLIRQAVVGSLSSDPDINVVAEATNGIEAVELALQHRPHVMLLDLHMPELGGLEVLERVRVELPTLRVLVLSASEKQDLFLRAIAAGAAGYLTKRSNRVELVNAIISVHGGNSVITPRLAASLVNDYANSRRGEMSKLRPLIGERELQVARLVSQGLTDREIGELLFISARTVQNHLARIRAKTGTHRRSEISSWAVEHACV